MKKIINANFDILMSKRFLTFLIAAAIIAVGAVVACKYLRPNAGHARTVSVSGECLTKVEKDRTAITLRVTVVDKSAAASLRKAQATYNKVSEYVKKIDDKTLELQTARFDSYEKTEWDHQNQKSVTVGYETNIELSVSSDNRAVVEDLLSYFADAENVFPGNLQMFSSAKKIKPAIESCIKDAVKNARDKAAAIAAADGAKIGKMVSAEFSRSAGGNDYYPRPMLNKAMGAVVMESADTGGSSLFSTDTEISVVVNAAFGLR